MRVPPLSQRSPRAANQGIARWFSAQGRAIPDGLEYALFCAKKPSPE